MNNESIIKKPLKEKIKYLKEYPEKMYFALEELSDEYPDEVDVAVNMSIQGKHLTEEMLEKAIEGMDFVDNITPWTLAQTNEVARSIGLEFNKFNQYDFNFMMNWYLSDMAEIWGNDATKYGKYARFMLEKDPDNDHPEERAFCEAKKFIKRHDKIEEK